MKKIPFVEITLLFLLCLFGGIDRFITKDLFVKKETNFFSQRELRQVEALLPLIHSSMEEIWPNFNILESPILLTFETGRIYAIGLKTINSNWKKISLKEYDIHFTDTDFWNLTGIKLHPAFEIEGQKAFVFQIKKEPNVPHLFAHERFHPFQLRYFHKDLLEGYSDHLNQNNLSLARLEDLLLKAFLEERDIPKKTDLLREFLTVNQERHATISAASQKWENFQQKIEGLAEYVAFRLHEGEEGLLLSQKEETSDQNLSDYTTKWRHYFVGAALAFALDFLEVPGWKEDVQAGKSLIECLKENLAFDPKQLEEIKRKFDFPAIQKKAMQQTFEFASEINKLKENYQAIEGLPFRIGTPRGLGISGGGSTERIISLEDGTTISLNDRSSSQTADSSWKFCTNSLPYLIQNGRGFREFKIDAQIELLVNNKQMSIGELLKNPGEYPFLNLHCEAETFIFSSVKHPGVIISDGKSLSVVYFSSLTQNLGSGNGKSISDV